MGDSFVVLHDQDQSHLDNIIQTVDGKEHTGAHWEPTKSQRQTQGVGWILIIPLNLAKAKILLTTLFYVLPVLGYYRPGRLQQKNIVLRRLEIFH